jgi:small-conductance mechanosensitive channel
MRALAQIWAPLIIVYLAAVYFFAAASALAGAPLGIMRAMVALLVILIGLPVLDRIVGLLFESRSAPGPESAIGHSRLVLRRAARIVLGIGAVLAVLGIFGLRSVLTQNIGAWLIRLTLNIGVVVLLAYVLRELTISWISRRLALESPPGAVPAGGLDVIRASRLKTILPLVQRALQVTILTIAALMILSAFGVSVGPLLAGAGVIGLAVGFGSQTLVKDLISGLFFLLDDAFRIGEYIEIEGFDGEVERINVRSLSLRTPLGAIHTIPFGGINAVANYSRDWAMVKLEFRVTYDTDMNKVKKIFRKIGEDLMQDPELGPGFLQPFKFQGVKALEETGILFRGKFMTLPGAQFQIRKAIFERVQKDFKEQGIKFAQRRVQVDLPPGLDLDEQTRATITNAAAAAVIAEPPAAPR